MWVVRRSVLMRIDTQILETLIAVSTSTLTGSLPCPLTAALPLETNPSTNTHAQSKLQDLTTWAEGRAGLEFSRREGVRAAAKGVGDVLRLNGAR